MIGRAILLLAIGFAVAGCKGRLGDEFALPAGHPANPEAPAAAPIPVTSALEPEFQDVRPKRPGETDKRPDAGNGKHHH